MTEKKEINWEKIELDYRAGIKSLRQIADEHGISHVSINKRAKRDGRPWTPEVVKKLRGELDLQISQHPDWNKLALLVSKSV